MVSTFNGTCNLRTVVPVATLKLVTLLIAEVSLNSVPVAFAGNQEFAAAA